MRQARQSCFPPPAWSATRAAFCSVHRSSVFPANRVQRRSFAINVRRVTGSRASSSRARRRQPTYRDRSDDSSFPRPCSWPCPQWRKILFFGSEHRNWHVADPSPFLSNEDPIPPPHFGEDLDFFAEL